MLQIKKTTELSVKGQDMFFTSCFSHCMLLGSDGVLLHLIVFQRKMMHFSSFHMCADRNFNKKKDMIMATRRL